MEKRPPLHLGAVAIELGAFESPLTKVANFNYLYHQYFNAHRGLLCVGTQNMNQSAKILNQSAQQEKYRKKLQYPFKKEI